MHPDPQFRSVDHATCETLIAEVGFGTIFAATPEGLRAARTPLLSAGNGVVQFHLSARNALTRHLAGGADALIVVNGPDGYVSPRWYANRDTVPTWNYVSLECEGPVTRMADEGLEAFLQTAIAKHEARLGGEPWRAEESSGKTWAGLFKGIVGFDMAVRDWRPTFKLSQNKPPEDRARIAEGLATAGVPALAHLVRGAGE
ncbi:FMN-binding negative transcriptional regulator [Erythrobacter sp. NFXS35]|uniref:FMN-binding negative transcriptional regulator n=1 Tax=Erythrobacter sp. NFXS35 TaxID=2818436 RepID=UPI0032DF4654